MAYMCGLLHVVMATGACLVAVSLVADAANVQVREAAVREAAGPAVYQKIEDLLQMISAVDSDEEPQEKRASPCDKSKCVHGECNGTEGRIKDTGLNYYCLCQPDYGGHLCEIKDPCDNCPDGTKSTLRTSMAKSGCFCYDKRARLLPIKA